MLGTSNEGLTYEHNLDKCLELFADADFAGRINATNTEDPASACSRTGFVIKCAGCPIIWKSKIQTENALSAAESECVALSTVLKETTPTMHFLKEIGALIDVASCDKIMKCTVFEDNNGAIELAKAPQMTPRTKHTAIKCYHFQSCVQKGDAMIEKINTAEEEADFFNKAISAGDILLLDEESDGIVFVT